MSLHADALAVLRAWDPADPGPGLAPRRAIVAHLEQHPDGMSRTCLPDHLTASTLVFNADGTQVLLTLHAKSGRWFQFGGHPELARPDAGGAALREAVEESGLAATDLAAGPGAGAARRACGAVLRPGAGVHHLDVMFRAVAPATAPRTA